MTNDTLSKYAIWATLFALASLAIAFMPFIGSLYYVIISGLVMLTFIQKGGKWNIKTGLLLIACVLSIMMNDTAAIFRSEERFALFFLVIIVVSPLCQNKFMNDFRLKLFSQVMWLLLFITVASCITYFLGIDLSTKMKDAKVIFYGGIARNSMMLAPCAGLSFLYLLIRLLSKHYPEERKKLYITGIAGLMLVSFIVLLISGSRGALVATVIGAVFAFYKCNRTNFAKFLGYMAAFSVVLALSSPLWSPYTKALVEKQAGNDRSGSATSSRDAKWEARLEEFNSSPMFGIGFSTVSLEHKADYIASGIVESGSSWLAILSMVGLVGFIPFLCLYIDNLWFLFVNDNDLYLSGLIGTVMCWFSVHMLVEGYVLAGGSFLCFILWLSIGAASAHRTFINEKKESEELYE